ncbi:hypothetical protein GCM10023321_51980 [Pseudonocardia eucalypti]|uniref:Lipid/polyisoprenoid-binding YceI-like domain-containing protein n=1 Tax=Pseudonocardia eucalypti TaxID=648755 RepID=A0ABP9QLS8_9PSEU|nr:polyisoprenoid-binding protein YceI [Pseudonocardia eucalypti]
MTRYKIVPGRCELAAQASSSLHPIRAEASELAGEIDVELADGVLDPTAPTGARIELATAALHSGNPLLDREIQGRLDARRYPRVAAWVREVTGPTDGAYDVHGELTLRHVTRPVTARATLVSGDRRFLEVNGAFTLDVRDFQLDPPKLLGLRVHPEVAVTVRIVAERS